MAIKHTGNKTVLNFIYYNEFQYLIFSGEGEHKCVVCSKVYNRARFLRLHMQSHSEDRPFVCETCGKAFKYNRNLKVHNQLHTNEKPYVKQNYHKKCIYLKLIE